MRVVDGTPEDHPTPLPIDASATPGVVAPTPRIGNTSTQMGPLFINTSGVDFTGDIAASMQFGMTADNDRRMHYQADMRDAQYGSQYGDQMVLPPVPEQATNPANDFLYPQGDQPGA